MWYSRLALSWLGLGLGFANPNVFRLGFANPNPNVLGLGFANPNPNQGGVVQQVCLTSTWWRLRANRLCCWTSLGLGLGLG